MGVDTKILCEVLARRLDPHISNWIHNDQNGFIPKRQRFHNIRRVLHIINENFSTEDTACLDARQAFNRIEWPYLFMFYLDLDLEIIFHDGFKFCMQNLWPVFKQIT